MILKFVIAAAATLSVLGSAGAVSAAEAAPSTAQAQPPGNPQAEALVRRYLAAIRFDRSMDALQAAMLPVIAEQSRKEHGLTEEDKQMLIDIVRKAMREKMMPKLIERMVPIYASTFTTSELQAMVEFYESPVGRSITDKIPALAPKGAEITRQLMPEILAEVVQEVLARKCPDGKCDAAKLPKPAAS